MPLPALPPPGFDELSTEEQWDYIEALWDRLANRPGEVPVLDWQRRILEDRLAAHRGGQGSSRPWSEIREELLGRLHDLRR